MHCKINKVCHLHACMCMCMYTYMYSMVHACVDSLTWKWNSRVRSVSLREHSPFTLSLPLTLCLSPFSLFFSPSIVLSRGTYVLCLHVCAYDVMYACVCVSNLTWATPSSFNSGYWYAYQDTIWSIKYQSYNYIIFNPCKASYMTMQFHRVLW